MGGRGGSGEQMGLLKECGGADRSKRAHEEPHGKYILDPDDGGSMFLRNVGELLLDYIQGVTSQKVTAVGTSNPEAQEYLQFIKAV
jgi:hypothetical protein